MDASGQSQQSTAIKPAPSGAGFVFFAAESRLRRAAYRTQLTTENRQL
jgi:hypothetical protein